MRLPPAILLTTVGSVIHRTLPPHSSLSGGTLEAITEALPFLADADLLAEGAAYNGMGVSFAGRDEMSETASLWRESLPRRLQSFECTDKVVLPPDQRGKISCRYRISFDATVPPAVLPGQRRRLDAAKLEYTPDGKTRVTAIVAGSIQLDKDQKRIIRFSEVLVADPFAVTSSIAHFELLNARAVALATTPSIVREPLAYWSALRSMMRIELEESVRRSRTDELAVLDGAEDGVSDEEFEAKFRVYIARIFALGFLPPAAAFALAKVLRGFIDQIDKVT